MSKFNFLGSVESLRGPLEIQNSEGYQNNKVVFQKTGFSTTATNQRSKILIEFGKETFEKHPG